MDFIPYSRQCITEDDIDAVCAVLKSDYLTQGPAVPLFEKAFALQHRVTEAVAVSSATAGLHIALLALGVSAGSRVWTSPNSFVASANCALYCGASIDFVDIDSNTRNMSVGALRAKLEHVASVGKLPDVVIPVDFAGMPCDMREIRELALIYKFKILEDASHAAGANYLGDPVGSRFADATVFSFHAVKIITTAEGGIVTTNDSAVADRLRLLRSHGVSKDLESMERKPDGMWYYEQSLLGYNYRMTDLQAALGNSQLRRLSRLRSQRETLVHRYDRLLADLPLVLPLHFNDRSSAWHLYVVEVDESRTKKTRGEIFLKLREENIGVNVHYIPIHTQPYYGRLGFRRGDFPVSERYYERAVTIPLFPQMTEVQQLRVAKALQVAFQS
jgi:UDP-4-amino-4,6-dideoxy-N-acetyl-beta-L-altrosamine transaminase